MVLAAASVTACSGDDDPKAAEPTSTEPTTSLTKPDAELKIVVRSMDHVRARDRAGVKTAVAKPIQQWFDGAFVSGDYPRNTYDEGFEPWTRDAAAMARRDRVTTTNAALGSAIVDVVADEQLANLYVYASKGRAGGATARVRLRLTQEKDTGELVRTRLNGSVYLTRTPAGWKIFGYDLSRTVVPS